MSTVTGSVIIGTGTLTTATNAASPINVTLASQKAQMVYTRTQINTALVSGPFTITKLGWNIVSAPDVPLPNYTIKLKHTTSSTVSTALGDSDWTTVLVISSYTPTAGGYEMLTLNTPFVWDGTSNIGLEVCFDIVSATSNSGQVQYTTSGSGYRFLQSNSENTCPLTLGGITSSLKPNIRFEYFYTQPVPTSTTFIVGYGNVNISVNSPFNTFYKSRKCQFIYTKNEINLLGLEGPFMITALAWYLLSQPGFPVDLSIKIGHTNLSFFSSFIPPLDNWTEVANISSYVPTPINQFNTIQFTTPFYWNGVDNILIETCFPLIPNFQNAGNCQGYYYNAGSRYLQNDITTQCPIVTGGTNTNTKPIVQFTYVSDIPEENYDHIMKNNTGIDFTITTMSCSAGMASGVFPYIPFGQSGTVTIGTGTQISSGTDASPNNVYFWSQIGQIVYTRAEINAAGANGPFTIRELGWYVSGIATLAMPNYTIRLKNVSQSDVSTALDMNGSTTVVIIPSYLPNILNEYNLITLTTPFVWNGIDNIGLEFCHDSMSGFTASGQVQFTSVLNGYIFSRLDGLSLCGTVPTQVTSIKPNIRFIYG